VPDVVTLRWQTHIRFDHKSYVVGDKICQGSWDFVDRRFAFSPTVTADVCIVPVHTQSLASLKLLPGLVSWVRT
jgi:hypothetical protein